MKVLLGIIIGFVAIVVVVILVAGYFGFVPGISNIFGSNKPVNLGTTYTAQDYKSAIAKSGVQFLNNADTLSLNKSQKTYGPAKAVNVDFTPAETLALLNDKAHAPDFPVKDWQLRVNPDGTAEVSAVVMMDKINNYSTAHGINNGDLQQVLDIIKKAGIVEKEVPFYVKGNATVSNGQLSFDATSVKIGRLPISADVVNSHESDIINIFNTHKNDVPGFSVKNASIVNGKIHFDGTLPSSVKAK
jgi:hypothetical protein